MSPLEYRIALARLGVTVYGAGKLLGVEPRTSRRWAGGERTTPGPVAHFLIHLVLTRASGKRVIQLLGEQKPRARHRALGQARAALRG